MKWVKKYESQQPNYIHILSIRKNEFVIQIQFKKYLKFWVVMELIQFSFL